MAGFVDNIKAGDTTLSGLDKDQSRSFTPRMRVRIKDFFAITAGLGPDNTIPTHIVLPTLTLSKEENGDNGLISVDITRAMGVGASGSATLVFANKDGLLYRGNINVSDKKIYTDNDVARDINTPTLEEETLIPPNLSSKAETKVNDPAMKQVLHDRMRQYIAELSQRRMLGNDIQASRREAILQLRAAVGDLRKDAKITTQIGDALKAIVRVELIHDVMAQVEIDMEDTKGRWFGVFTGFISTIKDNYSPSNVPTVTLECHDKLALFGRVLTVTARALAPALKQVRSENFQSDALSYFSDRLDAEFINDAISILVDTVNTTFTAQGYLDKARKHDFLIDKVENSKGMINFLSEDYGHQGANFIRAGLYNRSSEDVKNILGPKTRVDDALIVKESRSRFWSFDKSNYKPKATFAQKVKGQYNSVEEVAVVGQTVFSRLFRLWTFPQRDQLGVKSASEIRETISDNEVVAGTTELGFDWDPVVENPLSSKRTNFEFTNGTSIQRDLGGKLFTKQETKSSDTWVARDRDGETFVKNQVNAKLTKLPRVAYEDYRGLSPYWPYMTVVDGVWGGPAATGKSVESQTEAKITGRFTKGSHERQVFPDADIDSNKVPFRECGIFQYDRFFSREEALNGGSMQRFASATMRSMWTNVMNQAIPAIDKLNTIASGSNLDIYTTGLGDLIVALPRYNQVPVLNEDSILAGPDFTLSQIEEKKLSKTATAAIDRGDLYHGKEYVLTDFGLVNRSISKTEDGKVDRVMCQANFDHLSGLISPELAVLLSRGVSLGSEKFQAFYGDREMVVSQSVSLDKSSGILNNKESKEKGLDILGHYAAMVKTKMNVRPNTLDVTYKIPRPVELGRTVFLPDNAWLYYVNRITRSWSVGSDYNETYHGEYGHPAWFHVPIPWITLPNEPIEKADPEGPDKNRERVEVRQSIERPAPPPSIENFDSINQSISGPFEP